jgi:hypothetical protein
VAVANSRKGRAPAAGLGRFRVSIVDFRFLSAAELTKSEAHQAKNLGVCPELTLGVSSHTVQPALHRQKHEDQRHFGTQPPGFPRLYI